MPALQWWPSELTLQLYFVNRRETHFEWLCYSCTELLASSAVSNEVWSLWPWAAKTQLVLNQNPWSVSLLFPARAEHGAVLLVQGHCRGEGFSEQAWAKPTASAGPFLLPWVPSGGQRRGGAALGELGWPPSAPGPGGWHRGGVRERESRCLRVQKGAARRLLAEFPRSLSGGRFWWSLYKELGIKFWKVSADTELTSGEEHVTAAPRHLDLAVNRNSVVQGHMLRICAVRSKAMVWKR